MSRIAYVNGQFVAQRHAAVSMFDRGYQFADGIYEVIAITPSGALVDEALHLDRLERSVGELGIAMPMSRRALQMKIRQLLRYNRGRHGAVYMQVTRGVAKRNHVYPADIAPVLTMSLLPIKPPAMHDVEQGIQVITAPDERWARCDVKSISLLPNILARMKAHEQGLKEAWQVKPDGVVTEGSYSNAYLVDASGVVRTHPANQSILGGITRDRLLRLARDNGVEVKEEAFTLDDVKQAKEAFMTASTAYIIPIVQVDEVVIGDGTPGEVTRRLQTLYRDYANNELGV